MNICTIIAKNYVAHARVLAKSFAEHHPDGRCFVLFVDEIDGYIDPANEPFEALSLDDLPIEREDLDEMRGMYSVLEFSTAVKPWLLELMLEQYDEGGGVCYFDPDIQIQSRMVELEAALGRSPVVLTPHLTEPMPRDGLKPAETDILVAGVYNLGFIGLSRGEQSLFLVRWWQERLRTDCRVDTSRGLFVDQRWMDFAPGLVPGLEILDIPSYNVAYWNLATRRLTREGDGHAVNGHPLRFLHFSGYDPRHRERLSKHQDRIELGSDPVLVDLSNAYGDALEAAGIADARDWPYTNDVLPNGFKLDAVARALYRDAIEHDELADDIFSPRGADDLVAWLNEVASPGSERPLTRYLHAYWKKRPDLRQAYPDPGGADYDGFIGWCLEYGRKQTGIGDVLLPPAEVEASPSPPSPADAVSDAEVVVVEADREADPVAPFGVNVAGYLRSELGIGEVARQFTRALDRDGVPALPFGLLAPNNRQGHHFASAARGENPFPVNLVFVNADGFPGFAEEVGRSFFTGRHTIGFWWWELDAFPESALDAFDLVDEVWAGSGFVADAISRVSPVPVVKMPVPIEVTPAPPLAAGELGWPDAFSFLYSWDYNSVYRRKNPLAVIEAYTAAFGPDDGAALVLKCINHDRFPAQHAELRDAIGDRSDIVLMDGYVSAYDKDRLMATCDCYVSLHRSEGLGLTMAEALYLGKPVIATNYSGNTEFMTPENSFPVDYTLVPVGNGAAPYPADATWAEPSVEHAASLMRQVFDDRDEASRRAARGAADMRERFSAEAVGRAARRRLQRVTRRPTPVSDLRSPRSVPREDHVRWLVERGTTPRAPSRFGRPGAALRKATLRFMKPYTAYQGDINKGLLASVGGLRDAVDRSFDAVAVRNAGEQATMLAELRRQNHQIEQLRAETDELRRHAGRIADEQAVTTPIVARAATVEHELHAVPFMSADVLGYRDAGPVGRVLGYTDGPAASGDDGYRAFEELFRGSEQMITERQRRYRPILEGHGPVLDVGCGRGELLDVLAEAGIAARGVDLDPGMVARCREKGHEVEQSDAVGAVDACPDASLGAVFSAQLIEHLPPDELQKLIEAARAKLRPGGLFVAETVNPHSIPALKTFWVDVTHQHPLFPETVLALCRIAGFRSAYVFHPNGTGDAEADRTTTGEYAVVATA